MERTICFVFISCGLSDESFASKQFPEESLWKLNGRITHILGFCNCQCFLVVSVLWTDKCIDDCCENVMFSYLAAVVMGRIRHVLGLLQPRWLFKFILMWSMTCMIVLWQAWSLDSCCFCLTTARCCMALFPYLLSSCCGSYEDSSVLQQVGAVWLHFQGGNVSLVFWEALHMLLMLL